RSRSMTSPTGGGLVKEGEALLVLGTTVAAETPEPRRRTENLYSAESRQKDLANLLGAVRGSLGYDPPAAWSHPPSSVSARAARSPENDEQEQRARACEAARCGQFFADERWVDGLAKLAEADPVRCRRVVVDRLDGAASMMADPAAHLESRRRALRAVRPECPDVLGTGSLVAESAAHRVRDVAGAVDDVLAHAAVEHLGTHGRPLG